ncbi:NUDIX domain-containing protein [Paenibacillus thermoaerophilus]|uniref:NUDIX domain-containing protein n=1 Tax=Paenibacillus thermoaerophilus TaxID=1215385 RepID=A0ABW2V4V2_9BACL|nr:NUDIX domain-containing protein [Paenibacillus thermoaerophilus]TMV18809.1 NUDIX domain-containing protein [Paenibacillus thermoaerophilus]
MNEWFDIYDEGGRPIGTAPRSEVHARGYWHKTFQCWLYLDREGRRYVLFQRRQAGKDTYPLRYDITAAGHLAAGERIEEAVRELKEELGVDVPFERLVPLGEHRQQLRGAAGGREFVDNELCQVFACASPLPPERFRLQPEEVSGIYAAPLDDLAELFAGSKSRVAAPGFEPDADGAMRPVTVEVSADGFVPHGDGYYRDVFRKIADIRTPNG